jgi:hypothetical protein
MAVWSLLVSDGIGYTVKAAGESGTSGRARFQKSRSQLAQTDVDTNAPERVGTSRLALFAIGAALEIVAERELANRGRLDGLKKNAKCRINSFL